MEDLFAWATTHQLEHKCGAAPYQSGQVLLNLLNHYQPKQVLEIGAGVGYTTILIAQQLAKQKQSHLVSLEKDLSHFELATELIREHRLQDYISLLNVEAEDYLEDQSVLSQSFDLIFFDGFQIHYQFLQPYQRLLKPQGVLILGNNHLTSRTSNQFFEEILNNGLWKQISSFEDTTVYQKIK
ncbi:MAG: class I SAM-dependent methyltransferase [Candidatus Doudnabacteria bacterium]